MSLAWLKRYLPRGLYSRVALILLLPVVFVQVVVLVLFAQRQYEDVTKQMAETMARELRLVLDVAAGVSDPRDIPLRVAERTGPLEIEVAPVPVSALAEPDIRRWYDFSGIAINERLRLRLPQIAVVDLSRDRVVRLVVRSEQGALEVEFDRRRISANNPHQLIVNMLFFGAVVTVVAIIYLRNQLRPIKRLAAAAEAFGRGRHIRYTPAGAAEVRAAGMAFIDMRNRIERQIETRTLMLSGVSHDLRTPLTRMKLALSMLDDEDRIPLERDVAEMQHMIDEFLNFTKGAGEFEPEPVDPIALVRGTVEDAQRAGLPVTLAEVDSEGSGDIMLRQGALRRAIDNLISNAVRYGQHAEVSVRFTERSLRIRVEDDGPGIPESQRADALKAFTRLDKARNQDSGGSVGLGLAIAADIARAHGGTLRLDASEKLGGLRADIVISR